MTKLSISEKLEPMLKTWGRIRKQAQFSGNERLIALVEKFNEDITFADIKENHFTKNPEASYCPTCHFEYLSKDQKEAIKNLGECLNCDHTRSEFAVMTG